MLCLSLAAHTPDNSFMGFVAEELNETERLNIQRNKVGNMAVVYGKEASMWKVSVAQKQPKITTTTHKASLLFSASSINCT